MQDFQEHGITVRSEGFIKICKGFWNIAEYQSIFDTSHKYTRISYLFLSFPLFPHLPLFSSIYLLFLLFFSFSFPLPSYFLFFFFIPPFSSFSYLLISIYFLSYLSSFLLKNSYNPNVIRLYVYKKLYN